jgi:hypothetical protein
MEPASVTSAVDVRLIRILAKMAWQILDQRQDEPSSESSSRVSPEPPEPPETSVDAPKGRAR